ncbi:DUF4328 domain-containing protein [Streptomyces sp. SID13031]|uniref:DUF4328 domain-containing protein n=1 Tax=Streptomyces sp. SID13031 TaxID=2706046 RepID=UPI0013C8C40E|nr:DUF4328 domain-containing protein [Streptomyces sp. SID13031]
MSHPQRAVLSAVEENDEWQPHAAEDFQQVSTVGKIAIGLLGASTITHLLCTWSDWNTYSVVNTYLSGGPGVDNPDLNRADEISRITAIPNVIVSVAAAVVFVIWLWRVRVNSEVFCQADHRRSHGWVLASWFCPGPNLIYPKQIVDDIWLASDPKTPVYADDLRRLRKPLLTNVWWVAWVGALVFDVVIRRALMWMEATVGSLRGIALAGTASLLLTAVSAVTATLIIRKINSMQTTREWMPWWDQREPKLVAVPSYRIAADDDTSEQPAIAEPIAAPAPRLERQPALAIAAGAAFDTTQEAPPKWSPFAPAAETAAAPSWEDAGPATEQFSPVESWREDTGQVIEALPSYQQTASGLETPTWSSPSNPYLPAPSDDLLSAPLPSWQAETIAPPSFAPAQPEPYAYQPAARAAEPSEPSWASSYSEPYSYSDTSDYLTSSEPVATPQPAPEPEPAPVARAGRRAARVAVDSPSTVQAAVPASDGYYQQAPALPAQDDYLTPSKPLPTVPSYGPEPSYTRETSYSSPAPTYAPETTYTGYDAPVVPAASTPEYETSYTSDYSPTYGYSEPTAPVTPEPTYTPDTSYTSTSYDSYSSETSYETYSPTTSYDSYTTPEPTAAPETYSSSASDSSTSDYSGTSYDSSYSPTYTPETYSSDYTSDYSASYSDQPATDYQSSPYSYEAPAEPTPATPAESEKDDSETTAPRTVPRRRWV